MLRLAACVAAALLVTAAPAAGQPPSRPGPWALDVRGLTSPVPDDPAFYPPLEGSTLVPTRGFGIDVGGHVYLFNLGPSRVGVGANVANVRATTQPPVATPPTSPPTSPQPTPQDVRVELWLIAPQLSFNFGNRDGWSYLSAGMGSADVVVKTGGREPGRQESGRLNALNVGGGARWFLKSHLAFGFDIRMHRIGSSSGGDEPTPGMMMLVVGAGLSFR